VDGDAYDPTAAPIDKVQSVEPYIDTVLERGGEKSWRYTYSLKAS
jgi:hypothetical protein